MLARIFVHGVKLTIVSCCCPTETHATSTKETFYNTLSKALQSSKHSHPASKLVMCGDFNATIVNDVSVVVMMVNLQVSTAEHLLKLLKAIGCTS